MNCVAVTRFGGRVKRTFFLLEIKAVPSKKLPKIENVSECGTQAFQMWSSGTLVFWTVFWSTKLRPEI